MPPLTGHCMLKANDKDTFKGIRHSLPTNPRQHVESPVAVHQIHQNLHHYKYISGSLNIRGTSCKLPRYAYSPVNAPHSIGLDTDLSMEVPSSR